MKDRKTWKGNYIITHEKRDRMIHGPQYQTKLSEVWDVASNIPDLMIGSVG